MFGNHASALDVEIEALGIANLSETGDADFGGLFLIGVFGLSRVRVFDLTSADSPHTLMFAFIARYSTCVRAWHTWD